MSSQSHLRPLAVALFENEQTTQPGHAAPHSWDKVVAMLTRRDQRLNKRGPMIGTYAVQGKRRDANVAYRSCIQLDIDSEVERDKATGQVTRVKRQAPALAQLRPVLDAFEFVASSSHSHDPGSGVIKYRVTILVDRDIQQAEYLPILEELDARLGGCLDRNAWAWSQAFYLPSCPAHLAADAFDIRNRGKPLPVDEFIAGGRARLAAKQSLPAVKASGTIQAPDIAETPENISIVRAMLSAVPADCGRDQWRNALWAVRALGWSIGETVARGWSKTADGKYTDAGFDNVWSSFDPTRANGIGPGTLEHLARQNGYVGAALARLIDFDGKGADVANGQRFAMLFRNSLLFVAGADDWLKFDPSAGWVSPPPGEVDRAAKQVLDDLKADRLRQVTAGADEGRLRQLGRHIDYTSRATSIRAMIEMAKSEPGMAARLSEFDADPMLFGVLNGVLDLQTGTLLAPAPALRVSKRGRVAFDPGAQCPLFLRFLADVQPDPAIRDFLQRYCGYLLTGSASEQGFAFLHGAGGNGKSVFVETLGWLLGDYARKIQTELLMEHKRNPQGPSADIVALRGVRLAFAAETEENHRLSAARVKELTGGDTLSGRLPFAKAAVTFQPTHKLVMVGNYRPEISDMSDGMWRRLLLIGFDRTIPEGKRDQHLVDKLKGEGSGILNWALVGLGAWQRGGLQVPASIRQATTAYREEEDLIGEWIGMHCQPLPGASTPKGDLHLSYKLWAMTNSLPAMSQTRLTRRLRDRGYNLDRGRRHVQGLALKPLVAGQAV